MKKSFKQIFRKKLYEAEKRLENIILPDKDISILESKYKILNVKTFGVNVIVQGQGKALSIETINPKDPEKKQVIQVPLNTIWFDSDDSTQLKVSNPNTIVMKDISPTGKQHPINGNKFLKDTNANVVKINNVGDVKYAKFKDVFSKAQPNTLTQYTTREEKQGDKNPSKTIYTLIKQTANKNIVFVGDFLTATPKDEYAAIEGTSKYVTNLDPKNSYFYVRGKNVKDNSNQPIPQGTILVIDTVSYEDFNEKEMDRPQNILFLLPKVKTNVQSDAAKNTGISDGESTVTSAMMNQSLKRSAYNLIKEDVIGPDGGTSGDPSATNAAQQTTTTTPPPVQTPTETPANTQKEPEPSFDYKVLFITGKSYTQLKNASQEKVPVTTTGKRAINALGTAAKSGLEAVKGALSSTGYSAQKSLGTSDMFKNVVSGVTSAMTGKAK